ncbi:hypothetical protein SLNWT_4013 [Streptomyces albus]|uniref:Uncharacterized protein n=1 Tax=Streptomyces albus (strain ATCC 21838 / DSM 41398 / FERM P-419 / JCM 4703 / NBRC 107858) TaxID=1081613 RepID=A0A0B5ERZ1_STRA4|nr:hypothetical protein SLNWT_4013 [Streptomyces albus]AOU78698.1 hypothetical protein SLNHY_4007 [Streptomyces albus]AYN34434.1 hypothetical protein DUI70_3937 [Streptomyces albus]
MRHRRGAFVHRPVNLCDGKWSAERPHSNQALVRENAGQSGCGGGYCRVPEAPERSRFRSAGGPW